MFQKTKEFIKKNYGSLALLIFILIFDLEDFQYPCFKYDRDIIESSLEPYNKYFAILFFLYFVSLNLIKYREDFKKENKNFKDNIFRFLFILILVGTILLDKTNESVTDIALLINQQQSKGEISRTYYISDYDNEEKLLFLKDSVSYPVMKMSQEVYKNLSDSTKVNLTFKVGIFNIPFDPSPSN